MDKITVTAIIHRPLSEVWKYYTEPMHIVHWNFATDEWCCPAASSDFVEGGSFSYRMEAKDGSMGFDFDGKFNSIDEESTINIALLDGRAMDVDFHAQGDETKVEVTFDAEQENPKEMQQQGWQAILNNFKAYAEKSEDLD